MAFEYNVIRSDKRKTIALQIKNAEVTVRVPSYVSQSYIDEVIATKTPWIMKKLAESRQRIPVPQAPSLPGNKVLILGTEKTIHVTYFKQSSTHYTDEHIDVALPSKHRLYKNDSEYTKRHIKIQLSHWMKEQSLTYLKQRLPELSSKLQLEPSSYKVRLYKARWGSCNNKKELSFNYLLMMAPTWVFDYVIVHELCHIKHLNHSSKFWALVEQHMPDYKLASDWLKKNQQKMVI